MKSVILTAILLSSVLFAAGIPEKFPTDLLQFGRSGSGDDKEIVFDTAGDDPVLSAPDAGGQLNSTANVLGFGDGASSDKRIDVLDGSSPAPFLKWDATNSRWAFSNDGVTERAIGSGGGGDGGVNVLENPDFETGLGQWTLIGSGTFVEVVGGAQLFGDRSASFTPSAASARIESDAVEVPAGLRGTTGAARIFYTFAGSSNELTLQAYDETNGVVLAEGDLPPTPAGVGSVEAFILVPFPSAAVDVRLRIVASTSTSAIVLDRLFLGSNVREVNVASAELFTYAVYRGTTGCNPSQTSTTLADHGSDAACPAITVLQSAAAVNTADDDELNLVYQDALPPGTYKVTAIFTAVTGSSGIGFNYCIGDGSDDEGCTKIDSGVNGQSVRRYTSTSASFAYPQGQPSGHEFKIRSRVTSSSWEIEQDQANNDFIWIVERFPLGSEKALNLSQQGWQIDANIGGANVNLDPSGDYNTYTAFGSASLDLVKRSHSAAVGIPCSGSSENSVGSLTCSSGDEQFGAVFNSPISQIVEACAEFGTRAFEAAGAFNINATFQLMRTENNDDSTILEEGGGRQAMFITGESGTNVENTVRTCGRFSVNAGKNTIRLMRSQDIVNSADTWELRAARNSDTGRPDFNITIRPVSQNSSVIIPDAVTTPGAGAGMKMVSAVINMTSGTPVIESGTEYGNWIDSLNDNSLGDATINFKAGFWSEAPNCVCTAGQGAIPICVIDASASSTSDVIVNTRVSSGTNGDGIATVICHGK